MWKYLEITREDFETRKDFIESIFLELGAVSTDLGKLHEVSSYSRDVSETISSSRSVFEYRDNYYRVSEVLFPKKPFIVIEWSERIEDVHNNIMEDTDPLPYDLTDNEIRKEIKRLID